MSDALWHIMTAANVAISDMLIFLPSRRAVRTVEKMIAKKSGGTAILPTLVALGEGVDDDTTDDINRPDVISNTERVAILSRLLAADANVGTLATALTLAHDLVRMQDYLENEGINPCDINWESLVDEKYSAHFHAKAKVLNILSSFMATYAQNRITSVAARNRDIRAWINHINDYKLVIVCASTASVPATADLMTHIANAPHGRIILSGRISGRKSDFELDTNPYNSEHRFLSRLGLTADDVIAIDTGPSAIDFMNIAFGNTPDTQPTDTDLMHCHLITCPRESVEADTVAEIAARSIAQKKSVLVITPDAAGNQRIATSFARRGLTADFSGGTPGTMTATGRAILNLFDEWTETSSPIFDKIYSENKFNLFNTVAAIVDTYGANMTPTLAPDDATSVQIWLAIRDMSNALDTAGLRLDLSAARAFIYDAISGVSVRDTMNPDADIVVLGTIESRMQTADVVILTGLNDGMFPARGYENAWLPRQLGAKIGLPSPDRKVSLQSLDFMNLSCGPDVYWLRSAVSGGVQTTPSRFISRVMARRGKFGESPDILNAVLSADNVPHKKLDTTPPTPPADWSDVYVTELEHLIHNPYSFYVKHILRLRVLDDYWALPDVRDFGNLVHDVVEHATDLRPENLVHEMDRRALEKLGRDSVIFHFWHKRFVEIAPIISNELSRLTNSYCEISGMVKIAGRNVRARADRIWDGGVMDIKTGAAPTKSQLQDGTMPQLPIEAFMLQSNGFPIPTTPASRTPIMRFLQLRNNDTRVIEYDAATTQEYINSAVARISELFNMYSAGAAPYEYHDTQDKKYHTFDDLARRDKN